MPSAALGFLALALPRPAASQSGPAEQPPSEEIVSDWRLGPFYAKPMFALREVGFDSNVVNTTEAVSDFSAVIAPGLRLALPVGDNALTITQEVSYHYFRDLAERRAWNAATTIGGEFVVGPLTLALSEEFRKTSELYSDELFARPRRIENRFSSTLASDRESGAYLEGTFRYDITRFEDGELAPSIETGRLKDLLDRDELHAGGGLYLDVLAGTRLIAGGRWSRHDFSFGGDDRDADRYFLFSGLRFDSEQVVSGDIRVGQYRLEVGGYTHPELEGLGAEVDLRMELGGDSSLSLRVSHGSTYSDFSFNRFAAATVASATLRVPLGDYFQFDLSPRFSDFRYPASAAEALGARLTGSHEVHSVWMTGSVPLSGGVWFELGGVWRELTGTTRDYDGYSLTTGLRYGI